MSLNPLYVTSTPLQWIFLDKNTGEPLADGSVYFYSDVNRTTYKSVYELQGNQANYTYKALPNPLRLSGIGTPMDVAGNDVIPYFYPWNELDPSKQELYFIKVFSASGEFQYSRQAWPNPNEGGSGPSPTPGGQQSAINLIPNGQFLAHTNLPDNELVGGSNVIAQGGFSIELSNPIYSTNTLVFNALQASTITGDPRYSATYTTTYDVRDGFKAIRIQWPDVNKFSGGNQVYQFAFWAKGSVPIPVTIDVYKYFGTNGSAPVTTFQEAATILNTPPPNGLYSFNINFGSDTQGTIDPINNNDFVAIDIVLPLTFGFSIEFTDFVLLAGNTVISIFPTQINADMLSRGVAGSMPTPNPDGSDLYLPLVLTKSGMIFDPSMIGQIITLPAAIPAPSDPLATTNLMTFDASSYINSEYSALGIPYSRLGKYLLANSPIANIPLFGTGSDYATCYAYAGSPITLRLPFNAFGTGSIAASAGNSAWTFTTIPTFNGSSTGSATMGILAVSNVANTLLAYYATSFGATIAPDPGTSGFTINILNPYTGSVINQNLSQTLSTYTIQAVAGSTFVTGSAGKYFTFPNATTSTTYGMWFNTGTETVPTVSGSPPLIQVFISASSTAQDVANIVRETLNALQSTQFVVSTVPSFASQATWYWEFYTNPASPTHFYVWYKLGTLGTDPNIPNATGIMVQLNGSGETTTTVATKTLQAINAYQYAVPGPGMFLRSYDPTGVWDFDVLQRWSSISGLSGANYGTFEFDQLQQHAHPNDIATSYSVTSNRRFSQTNTNTSSTSPAASTGGSETRPVNMFVNYAIRY